MSGVLQVMRRPRTEYASADDDDSFAALYLSHRFVPCRQNGSAAGPGKERAARYLILRRACRFAAIHPAAISRVPAPVAAEAEEAVGPDRFPWPGSPIHPRTSASQAAEVAEVAGAAVPPRRPENLRTFGEPLGR